MELSISASTIVARNEESEGVAVDLDDVDSFERIVASHQRLVYRIILAIVHDEMLADSLTQDTFVRAWRKRSSFRGDGDVGAWLSRIGVNLAKDELRRRSRWRFSSLSDEEIPLKDRAPGPDQIVRGGEIGTLIRQLLDDLSPRQRIVFTLRHYEGHSLEAIARITGMKPATARVHLHRATTKLRDALAPYRSGGNG